MNILIINKSYLSGGAGYASGRLFQTLKRSGTDVSMMVFDPFPGQEKGLIRLTVSPFHKLRWWYHFLMERICFLPFEKSKKERFALSPAVSGVDISKHPAVVKADILHLHWFNQGFLSFRSLEKLVSLGKPVVFTLHDMWAFTGGCHYTGECDHFKKECGNCILVKNPHSTDLSFKGFLKKQRLYQRANFNFVTCSHWLAGIAGSSSLLKNKAIISIPNSIDTGYYTPENKKANRAQLNLPTDKKLILFGAANLNETRKGLAYFLEALSSPVIEGGQTEIIVFGKNSSLMVRQEKCKVHDFGLVSSPETMKSLFQSADAFIIPTLQDNLPNTVMESMACATPVVAFKTGGIPEMIDHKRTGYLAQYKSAEDLARGIVWVLANNENNVLGKAAREKVVREYSEEVVAKQYIQLYQSLLNGKTP